MTDRATLARLGKLVAAETEAGRPGANTRTAFALLEERPEAVLDLLDLLAREARRKRPDEGLIPAYAQMIGQGLEIVRYGVEGGRARATELADAARRTLRDLATSGQLGPDLVLAILREFVAAKLDPGPELRALVEDLAAREAPGLPEGAGISALEIPLRALAEALGGDPFEMHAQMQAMGDALPEEHRAAMGALMAGFPEPAVREAALGWLFDSAAPVRRATAGALEQAAGSGLVSPVALRRLLALRPWLPEADRPALDQAIAACRQQGLEPEAWPEARLREVLATGIDGAGAQSLFVLGREGRRNAFGGLLLKEGVGVRDAWGQHGLSRPELDGVMDQIGDIDTYPIGLAYVRLAAAHALAGNLASGTMPPFALLDVVEMAGLTELRPASLAPGAVLDLVEAAPEPAAAGRAEPVELGFLESWFEDDDEVARLLGGKGATPERRIALVQDELLPRRAAKWVGRLAWTALTLRHGTTPAPWEMFLEAARDIEAGGKMGDIPLMEDVAATTVEAFLAHEAARRAPRPAGRRRVPRS